MNRFLVIGIFLFLPYLVFAAAGEHLPFVKDDLEGTPMVMEDGKILIPPYPPSEEFLFGTDNRGRDLLSMLVIGTRETLLMVLAIAIIRYAAGLVLGCLAYFFKWAGRALDIWNYSLSFVPQIFFFLLLLGLPFIFYSTSLPVWFLVIISLSEAGRVADMVRIQIEHLSQNLFIEAAITNGTSRRNLLLRHYLPHLRPQMIVNFFSDMGRILFLLGQLAIVGIFLNREFISAFTPGAYESVNTSYAYPLFLQNITQEMWLDKWIPITALFFIVTLMISFFFIAEGLKKMLIGKVYKSG